MCVGDEYLLRPQNVANDEALRPNKRSRNHTGLSPWAASTSGARGAHGCSMLFCITVRKQSLCSALVRAVPKRAIVCRVYGHCTISTVHIIVANNLFLGYFFGCILHTADAMCDECSVFTSGLCKKRSDMHIITLILPTTFSSYD